MLGVVVNSLAVIFGSLLGLLVKKLIKDNIKSVVMQALGIAVICAGILDVTKTQNVLLLVLSLVVGGIIGALCHIQIGIERFGAFLQNKFSKSQTSTFGQAFVNATLITCVGAMVIYGSIQAGQGNNTTLYIKSVLDFTMCTILASKLGIGTILCAIPVFVLQGAFALLSSTLTPIMTVEFLNQLTGTGGALMLCIGINILEIKKINTADLLPSIILSSFIFLI